MCFVAHRQNILLEILRGTSTPPIEVRTEGGARRCRERRPGTGVRAERGACGLRELVGGTRVRYPSRVHPSDTRFTRPEVIVDPLAHTASRATGFRESRERRRTNLPTVVPIAA